MTKVASIRYNWLDVFKGLCIFFIIFSHLGGQGKLAPFVFSFMVHSFFFASGLTAKRSIKGDFKTFIFSKFKRLMIPYFSFGIINIGLSILTEPSEGISPILNLFKTLLIGNRLSLFAVTLWFIPCLFVLSLMYFFISKFIQNRYLRFALCILASFVFRLFSEGNVLPWGIDNAVRYLIYYAAGDFFADFLNKLSVESSIFLKHKWLLLAIVISSGCAFLQYQFGYMYFPSLMGFQESYMVLVISGCFQAFNGIFLIAMISIAMQEVKFLQLAGKETLLICCMQRPVDKLVYAFTSLFGLTINSSLQVNCLALATIFVYVSIKIVKPMHLYFPYICGDVPVKSNTQNTP